MIQRYIFKITDYGDSLTCSHDGDTWEDVDTFEDNFCKSADVTQLEQRCEELQSRLEDAQEMAREMNRLRDRFEEKGLECYICAEIDTGYCDFCKWNSGDPEHADEFILRGEYMLAAKILADKAEVVSND